MDGQDQAPKVLSALDQPLTEEGFSVTTKYFGKSIHNASDFSKVEKSTINTFEKKVGEIPVPKKFALAQKKKALEEKKKEMAYYKDQGLELPAHLKKKKVDKKRFPEQEPIPPPLPITVDEALEDTMGWSSSNTIAKKFACGTLSTASHTSKVDNFVRMNEKAEELGSLYPQSCYFGRPPKEGANRFDRRVVK